MGGGWAGVLLPHLDTSLIQFVHTCVCLCVGGRGIHWLSQCIQLPVACCNNKQQKNPFIVTAEHTHQISNGLSGSPTLSSSPNKHVAVIT